MQCEEDRHRHANAENAESKDKRQETQPTNQAASATEFEEDVHQIIKKITSIAQEIGWLAERKAPVENASTVSASKITSQ